MTTTIESIDPEVFKRYAGLSLPRHVSYPMPTGWGDFDEKQAGELYAQSRAQTPARDLSLYLHVPFCERMCLYCACTRVIQPKKGGQWEARTSAYVDALEQEIRTLPSRVGNSRMVRQIHWGGGTPTYLTAATLARLHQAIADNLKIAPDAEVAIEVDPRVVTPESLAQLREAGFNRVSLGVQDFDPCVQKHVGRVQPFELVRDTVAACRRLGFASVNFDLIYGLPYQTLQTIRDTIDKTIEVSPDRIAYYHYAQIPEKIAAQRGLNYAKLPDSETKLHMFLLGLERFESAGYLFIGLDHFAKPDEGLAQAMDKGTLQRTFQGMTTGGGLDLIGLGSSSITHLAQVGFLQHAHDLSAYMADVREGRLPIRRGKQLTEDDRIRQALMTQLYCAAEIRPATLEAQFGIDFPSYFAREMVIMSELAKEGLVTLTPGGGVAVTRPLGRVLIRNVAGVFDAYLDPEAYRMGDQRCFSASA